MLNKNEEKEAVQGHLFKVFLKDIISASHPMIRLADSIDWKSFEDGLAGVFCAGNGRPSCSVRLMIGLHYLKYMSDLSDRDVLDEWVENPYWQYFCGGEFFEHEAPIDSSSMTNWRKYLSEGGAEKLLEESIRSGLRTKIIRPKDIQKVNADTTVQEKHVRFPTDARLYDRMREKLVRKAKASGIVLRQSYEKVGKRILRRQSAYAHATQMKRAAKETRKLKNILGRVIRDIQRKSSAGMDSGLGKLLEIGSRLFKQKRDDRQKIYSVHEPQAECISKGKIHKKYEFGCKAGIVTSSDSSWILGAMAFHGNPYDGHTLDQALKQVEKLTGLSPERAFCDLGYRKHNYQGPCDVQIVNRHRKTIPAALRKYWKRRSAIEPVIGHVKEDYRMNRNRLKGTLGDKINVLMASAALNMSKILRAIALFLCLILRTSWSQDKIEIQCA